MKKVVTHLQLLAVYDKGRGGGLSSPILFAVHVDVLIHRPKKSEYGCHINGTFLSCLCYAGDTYPIIHIITWYAQTATYL